MLKLSDINTIECDEDASPEELACALQRAINSLEAWKFQGSMGRSMMRAIEAGHCMLGLEATKNYYGANIPSRTDVLPSTLGSREWVVNHMGEEWAQMIEGV